MSPYLVFLAGFAAGLAAGFLAAVFLVAFFFIILPYVRGLSINAIAPFFK